MALLPFARLLARTFILAGACLACLAGRAAGADPPSTGNDGDYYLEIVLSAGYSGTDWTANGHDAVIQVTTVWKYTYNTGGWHRAGNEDLGVSVTTPDTDATLFSDTSSTEDNTTSFTDQTDVDGVTTRDWYCTNPAGDSEITFHAAVGSFCATPPQRYAKHGPGPHLDFFSPRNGKNYNSGTFIVRVDVQRTDLAGYAATDCKTDASVDDDTAPHSLHWAAHLPSMASVHYNTWNPTTGPSINYDGWFTIWAYRHRHTTAGGSAWEADRVSPTDATTWSHFHTFYVSTI